MKPRFLALLVLALLGAAQAPAADLPAAATPDPVAPLSFDLPEPREVAGCVGTVNWFAFSESYCNGSEAGGHCGDSCAAGETGELHGWNGDYCKCVCCVDEQ